MLSSFGIKRELSNCRQRISNIEGEYFKRDLDPREA